MKKTPIILLAPQRSGTTVFQKTLAQSKDIQTFGEVFHNLKGNSQTNFFNFANANKDRIEKKIFPTIENSTSLFEEYFAFLNEQATSKYFIVDIKQNSTHHFNAIWHNPSDRPVAIDLLIEKGYPIFRIKRRNIFSQVISTFVANKIGKYHIAKNENVPSVDKFYVNIPILESKIKEIENSNIMVDAWLEGYSNAYHIDYEEMYEDNCFSPKLQRLVSDVFGNLPINKELVLKKINKSISDRIDNIEEIKTYFSETKYEHMIFEALGKTNSSSRNNCSFLQQRVTGIEENYNRWCKTGDPSNDQLHIHPNAVGSENPSVSFLGVNLSNSSGFKFSAIAGNESDMNPGAVITAKVIADGKIIATEETHLPPHETKVTTVTFNKKTDCADVIFTVSNTPNASSNNCSGILISNLDLL